MDNRYIFFSHNYMLLNYSPILESAFENEYKEILEIYKSGKYRSEKVECTNLKDRSFYPFYIPFLQLAKFYAKNVCKSDIAYYFDKGFEKDIINELEKIAIRVLIDEIRLCKSELKGNNSREQYDFYINHYLKDKAYINELFQFYPVLLKCILEKIYLFINYFEEVFVKWKKDLELLTKSFGIVERGKITNFEIIGDIHNKGKATMKIVINDQWNVYYKPHDLKPIKFYYNLLNEIYREYGLNIYDYAILDMGEYGWEREVIYKSCSSKQELHRYFLRMGIHIMVNYIFDTQDMHYENLIAHGEFPVFIDIEVLCSSLNQYKKNMSATDKAKLILNSSILGSGILPQKGMMNEMFCAIEGTGGIRTQWKADKITNLLSSEIKIQSVNSYTPLGKNKPIYKGRTWPVQNFLADLDEGFSFAYRYIKKAATAIIGTMKPMKMRLLINNTQYYSKLLQLSYNPSFMVDRGDRQLLISKFIITRFSDGEEANIAMFEEEIKTLLLGEIPYFSFSSISRDLQLSDGGAVEEFFGITPEMYIRKRLESLSSEDLEFQRRILYHSFGTACPVETDFSWDKYIKKFTVKQDLLKDICVKIGDYIVHVAIENNTDMDIAWLIPMKGFGLHVADVYLYQGIAGIAIFLTALNNIVYKNSYQKTINKILNRLKKGTMDENETETGNSRYIGAMCGESSIVYTYLVLYKITRNIDFINYAEVHINKVLSYLGANISYDFLYGDTGVILILIDLYKTTGKKRYLREAERVADYLNKSEIKFCEGLGKDVQSTIQKEGLAHGYSGYAMSLLRLYTSTKKSKYLVRALKVMRKEEVLCEQQVAAWNGDKYENTEKKSRGSWCHGIGGITLIYKELVSNVPQNQRCEVEHGFNNRLKELKGVTNIFMESYCLCHGLAGNLMILKSLGAVEDEEILSIFDFLNCSEIKNIENGNPGFMTGLSGIGYALLSILDNNLPNILCLEI